MYSVHILKNSKNHLYIGSSHNVTKRVSRHNAGDGAEFTRRNKNFELVYEETYQTLLEARRRELQLKGWSREKKNALINGDKELLKILSKKVKEI